MSKREIIDNLNELIARQRTQIKGQQYVIDYLKSNQGKAVRELEYLRSRYDSADERKAVEKGIEIVKKCLECN